MQSSKKLALIDVALQAPDDFVLQIVYLDGSGNVTERVVSPIRYLTPTRLSVYCLGREAVRTLALCRIMRVRIGPAADVLAPELIKNLCVYRQSTGTSQRKR